MRFCYNAVYLLLLTFAQLRAESEPITDEDLLASLGLNTNEKQKCENDELLCVPYHNCDENDIISDGFGLINIRGISSEELEKSLKHSDCTNILDVCCLHPHKSDSTNPVTYVPTCGKRNNNGIEVRISGFQDNQAQFGEFPWTAAILRKGVINGTVRNIYTCMGALINQRLILTAAHCVIKLNADEVVVRLGEWDTRYTTERLPHVDIKVASIQIHENFDEKNLRNNIALILLEKKVELQPHIDTLCLPNLQSNLGTNQFDFTNCVVAGWGKEKFHNGTHQVILKSVELVREEHDNCERKLQKTRLTSRFRLHSSFTCAQAGEVIESNGQRTVYSDSTSSVADACTGDGGSPLACLNRQDGKYYHAGIVAFGIECGVPNVPGVYTDTTLFADWIENNSNNLLGNRY